MGERRSAKKEHGILISAEYLVRVIGPDGKVKAVVKGPSHSLVRNALRYLYGQLSALDVSLKNTANAAVTALFSSTTTYYIAHFKWCYGVGCGESNTAWSIDQYELITKYREVLSLSFDAYTEADSTGYWIVTGGIEIYATKSIQEICLYGWINNSTKVMIARDVITPVSVADGDTLAVTYKLKTKAA